MHTDHQTVAAKPGRETQPRSLGLTLVLGAPNSGKMGYALEWWSERLSSRSLVVSPTGMDARELTVEMARRAGALVDQSPAVTFDGLAHLILGSSPPHPTEFEDALMVSRLLRQTEMEAMGSVAHLPGYSASLLALLRQLAESGRTPAEADRLLESWGRSDSDAAGLAADIRRLNRAYVEVRERSGFGDGPTNVGEAARQVAWQTSSWTRPVAFYGFTSFTPGQRRLIEALSSQTEVLVSLSYDRSRPVSLVASSEVAWLQAAASEIIELSPRMRAYSSPAIAYLERYFLRDPPLPEIPRPASNQEGVHFLLASGQRNEVELAAQQIATLIRQGFAPARIAVIVRSVRAWGSLLAQVFTSCGLPYHLDDRSTFSQTGLGKAFLCALQAVAYDDAEALLAYLRSPYSGLDVEATADLELHYRRQTGRGARALTDLATGRHREMLDTAWNVIPPVPGTPRVDVDALEHLGTQMLLAGVCDMQVGSPEVGEDAMAFRALSGALSSVRGLASGDGGAEWLDVATLLRPLSAIPVSKAGVEPADAVQILSAQRARARRFDAVFVLGLVEGEFPGPSERPRLLTRAQRARIDNLAGGGLFPTEGDQEAALFVSAVSRAWQLLFLSARDADDGGGEAAPSYLWHLSKELLGIEASQHERRTLADLVFDPSSAPSPRDYLRGCVAYARSPHPSVSGGPAQGARRAANALDACLADPSVLGELAALDSFSPSALEAYLTCPFAWFAERVVGIGEFEPRLDDRAIGQLSHCALSALYEWLRETGRLPLRAQRLAEAMGVARSIIDGLTSGDSCPGTAADRRLVAWRLKRLVRNVLETECDNDGLLEVAETESVIGGREGVDVGGLKIRGRIDRIDARRGEAELFVVDYKSGSAPPAASIGTERGLQLPLYLMALGAARPDARVIGGAYLSLASGQRRGVVMAGCDDLLGSGVSGCRVLDEAEVTDLFNRARELANRAAAGMRMGDIAARPEPECPSWCGLGPVCRSRRAGYRS